MKTIHFTKMHGAGNDYVYVDAQKYPIADPSAAAIRWSDRHKGIGSDGLILIDHSDSADFKMRMYNNDGSEGLMCGNGVRCIAKFVYDHRMTDKKEISIDTRAGIKVIRVYTDAQNLVESATVDMGEPILSNPQQMATPSGSMREGKISAGGREYVGTFVSMGNPHFVIPVADIESVELEKEGPLLERHPLFPQYCNIEFAQVRPDGTVRTRVWERGSGITMACGTGACATAVALQLTGRAGRSTVIAMDGGDLHIEWKEDNNHVYLTGPAATVFEGDIEL
jgi:diaminopimelate epimerase